MRTSWLALAAGLATAAIFGAPAPAQTYPTRPVTIIVPFAPGGGSDSVARIVAAKLTETLNVQFIVDNKGGGGTNIGGMIVRVVTAPAAAAGAAQATRRTVRRTTRRAPVRRTWVRAFACLTIAGRGGGFSAT